MHQKITLSRRQIEQIAVYLALNSKILYVKLEQDSSSGIGSSHWVEYHTEDTEVREEITDVSNW